MLLLRMGRNTNYSRRRMLKTTGGLTVGGALAGCLGGGDGGDGGNSGGGNGGGSGGNSSGGGQNTTASLEKRAKEEGMAKVAQSMSGWKPFISQFQNETGVKIELYRTDSTKIASRILQEYNANKLTFDVMGFGNTVEVFTQLIENGVVQQYVPKAVKEANAVEQRMFADKHGQELYAQEALVFLYNKNEVSSPPTTIQEWIDWDGSYTLDVRDLELLAALRQAHDKQRAKEIVGKLAADAAWRSSHFDAAKQVASGEVQAGVTYSKYRGYDWGGPLKKQKIEGFPTVSSTASYGLAKDPPHPAAAKYWVNYVHNNIVKFMNQNVYDGIFYKPENIPQDHFVWDYEYVSQTDLKALEEDWKQAANLNS